MPTTTLVSLIAVSLVLSAVFVPVVIRLGHKYGILDMPGKHKKHKRPTPLLGGLALFITTWLTVGIGYLLFHDLFQGLSDTVIYVFLGGLIILLVGLSDDLSPTSAWVKLAAQAAAGLLLYLGGLRVVFLAIPFQGVEIDVGWLSVVITVLWVIVLTNAINLIDGLDGLASGVSLIGALSLMAIGQLYQVGPVLVFVLVLVGFLSLFLYYNRYPARVFLGDSGSMQIGYYFALFSLAMPLKSYTATALYMPLLALGVPLMEVLSSAVRRSVSGRNIMRADRRHLFHYLSLMGFSRRQVVFTFYLLAVIYGLLALAMFYWNRLIVFGSLVVFMVVIFGAFFILLTKFSDRRRLNGRQE
ncbi:MAG: undecaprenyl/decaprenyl-phosphate alpha-N-acetylglucosaminyl 1-phosphate transferase [Candidatus Zixiibacteriota bacterium]|nr:MAG: undecaprenyl/decaprenyl-phosphate alpha-N-acetylglucosaminyl 1-phosphate transferase [candidate division Zixibacteria bacterium]